MLQLQEIDGDQVTNFERVTIAGISNPQATRAHVASFQDEETGEEIIFGASSKRALLGFLDCHTELTVDSKRMKTVLMVPTEHAELNWE